MADLKRTVWQRSADLNSTEKTIIQYVLDHPQEIINLSLKELSSKLFVSESAIFRLCKKLGLSGFTELKFELKPLVNVPDKDQIVNLTAEMKRLDQDVLKYYQTLNLDSFFKDLLQTRRVYLYSTGWLEKILVDYLSYQLFLMNKSYFLLPSAISELKMAVSRAQKGDMLIFVSWSGNNEASLKELERINLMTNNLKTVSLTNYNDGKMSSKTDYSFFFKVLDYSSKTGTENQRSGWSPAFELIDLLFSGYTQWLKDSKK